MLFTYGRTAPTVPRTTPTRRNHHPSPGPHDHTAAGPDVPWAPQNPPIVNVPTSLVASPGIATTGEKSAISATPRTMRLTINRLRVGIVRPYSIENRASTTARTTNKTRSKRYAVPSALPTARKVRPARTGWDEAYGRIDVPSHAPPR